MLRTRLRIGRVAALVMSTLLALLLTLISHFDVLLPRLAPTYDDPTAVVLRVPYDARIVRDGGEDLFNVHFEHHRIAIPRGTQLDPSNQEHRAALEFDRLRRPPRAARAVATWALYLFGCLLLISYFMRFGVPRLQLMRSQIGLFALLVMAVVAAKAMLLLTTVPIYWIPLSAIALWVALGFDRRTAALMHIAITFMVVSLLRFDVTWLTVFVARGLTTTLMLLNRKQPKQMLSAGLAGGVVAALIFASLGLSLEGSAALDTMLRFNAESPLLACVGGGVLSGVLGYLLREPGVYALGQVSRSRLLDLTDIEAPLLRKMATEAPGSWEHSRAMANLAEAAAASIGADSLLTRVGAYYHDLGKTVQCKYFIENLTAGEASPHDDLEPEVSADAIMAHVVLGTQILRDGGVPEPVVEFAYTHHGTQRVEYFWNKYRKAVRDPDEPMLDEDHFRYPGMKPMTKETAILMLVDSVEAASRTISPPEHDKFQQMIQRVVFSKLENGQLDESGLTLVDLRIMTQRMASTLVNMYHSRIKYPWQIEQEKQEAAKRAQQQADGTSDGGDANDDPPMPSC